MSLGFLPDGIAAGTAALLVFASFFTSALTAAFGLGGGLTLLALLGLFLPVAVLIPVHGLVQLGSNAGRAFVQRRAVAWGALPPFFAGALVGALLGAYFVVELPEPVLQLALGLFILLIAYVKVPGMGRLRAPGFALAGAATTFLGMFFGATGPLNAGLFAQTFSSRMTFVGTLAATTAVQHAMKAFAFLALGVALGPWLPMVAAMIATGFLGTVAGTRLLRRMEEKWFRIALTVILTLLALDLLRRGLAGLI